MLDLNTFSADVVPGRKKDGPQPENKFAQETGLGILEYLHSLERIKVHVNGNFRLKFVCVVESRKRHLMNPLRHFCTYKLDLGESSTILIKTL